MLRVPFLLFTWRSQIDPMEKGRITSKEKIVPKKEVYKRRKTLNEIENKEVEAPKSTRFLCSQALSNFTVWVQVYRSLASCSFSRHKGHAVDSVAVLTFDRVLGNSVG